MKEIEKKAQYERKWKTKSIRRMIFNGERTTVCSAGFARSSF